MSNRLGFLPFISVFFLCFQAEAQAPDSLNIGYFYLERPDTVSVTDSGQEIQGRDFVRKRILYRLDLHAAANQPVQSMNIPGSNEHGIVAALLYGLRNGRYSALHPANLQQSLSYLDFLYYLISLEGTQPGNRTDSISPEDIGIKWTYRFLDVIADEGFSPDNSRAFFRVRFLRLLWVNPHSATDPKIVMVFPFESVSSYLEQIICRADQGKISAKKFLELQMFQAREVSFPHDPASPIPMKLPATDRIPIRNIDLWKN
ncbi:MAG: hypothetical protein R3C61_27145 [Bacteroidia bacterium]